MTVPEVQALLELARVNVVHVNESIEDGDLNAASTYAFQAEDVLAELGAVLEKAA